MYLTNKINWVVLLSIYLLDRVDIFANFLGKNIFII